MCGRDSRGQRSEMGRGREEPAASGGGVGASGEEAVYVPGRVD